jgi:F-type H+-transporting ATPase subunit epsilon
MDSPKFTIEVVTPDGVVFSRDVVSVKIPGSEGMFGVLANHAPFVTAITIGTIEAFDGEKNYYLATSGGFTEVLPQKTTILAETAEAADSIDLARAEASAKRARDRLESHSADVDVERAQLSLRRAINRIKIASM